MNIKPLAGPLPISSNSPSTQAQDARQRAVQAYSGAQPAQPNPVPTDANNVSPEEIKSVTPPTQIEQVAADASAEQKTITEATEVPAPTPQATEKTEDPSLTDKYQLLARREKAIRAKAVQQEQKLKAREAELEAKAQELATKAKEYEGGYISKSQLKQAAMDAILAGEIPYEEVTEQMVNQQRTDPRVMSYIQKLEAKISKLESGVEETRTNYINSQDAAYKQAVKQIHTDVKALVANDPEFELIKTTGSDRDVVELIEQTFKQDGTLLSVEEAAKEVEEYLVEEATKLAKSNKIQKRMQPVVQPAQPAQKTEQQPKPQPQMKTLTNATASTRKLSPRERALLAFKGEVGKD